MRLGLSFLCFDGLEMILWECGGREMDVIGGGVGLGGIECVNVGFCGLREIDWG